VRGAESFAERQSEYRVLKDLLNIFLGCPMGAVVLACDNFPLLISISDIIHEVFAMPKLGSWEFRNQIMLDAC